MARVIIVYHSRSGNTEKMARCVAEGAAAVPGATVELRKVADTTSEDLLNADAVIMGSPVYYGGMAAELKKLIDDSVKFHKKLDGKIGAAFASSGAEHGGNESTILDILHALLIHGMIVHGDPVGDHYGPVAVGAPDGRSKKSCLRLGQRVAELAVRLFN